MADQEYTFYNNAAYKGTELPQSKNLQFVYVLTPVKARGVDDATDPGIAEHLAQFKIRKGLLPTDNISTLAASERTFGGVVVANDQEYYNRWAYHQNFGTLVKTFSQFSQPLLVNYTILEDGTDADLSDWATFRARQTGALTGDEIAIILDTATDVDDTTDTFTYVDHGLVDDDQVVLTGADLPAPLVAGTTYFVVGGTDDTFQLSATEGGAAIDLTDAGTGTFSVEKIVTSYTAVLGTGAGGEYASEIQLGSGVTVANEDINLYVFMVENTDTFGVRGQSTVNRSGSGDLGGLLEALHSQAWYATPNDELLAYATNPDSLVTNDLHFVTTGISEYDNMTAPKMYVLNTATDRAFHTIVQEEFLPYFKQF